MPKSSWDALKNASLTLLALLALAGWVYSIYNEHRANDPLEIVRRHFIFYAEYSHGAWQERPCGVEQEKCRKVTYTIPVKGCGPVTFDWRVGSGEDGDRTWFYDGASPRFDEDKYPLYAVLGDDSRLIDSPALGKPLPDTCQLK
jgi:hypothetical protein